MTDREKVARLAGVMGWKVNAPRWAGRGIHADTLELIPDDRANLCWWPGCGDNPHAWNVLESHDAIAEVLAKLTEDQLNRVIHILTPTARTGYDEMTTMLLATPTQKADAILKALGLWEE